VGSLEKRVTKQKCERLEENGRVKGDWLGEWRESGLESEERLIGRVVGRVRKEQECKILKENMSHRGNEREDEN